MSKIQEAVRAVLAEDPTYVCCRNMSRPSLNDIKAAIAPIRVFHARSLALYCDSYDAHREFYRGFVQSRT